MTKRNTKNNGLSRRDVLKGAAGVFAAGGLVAGCDEDDGDGHEFDELELEGDRGPSLDPAECEGGAALSPQELLAPIDHIVVLMMENRSFDHMFGSLSLLEGRTDVDGLKGGETNPGANGEDVEVFHLDTRQKLHHLPHKWEPMHDAFNDGRNDGFVLAHHEANKEESLTAGPEVMGFLKREDVPVMYELADHYSLCDRWFCSVMGPTWPNRFFMHAASSGGRQSNRPKFFLDSVWGKLRDKDLKGKNYFSDLPWAAAAMGKIRGFSRLSSFFKDAQNGELPDFSIIDPGFFFSTSDHPKEVGGDSDHPEMGPNVNLGQILISTIYKALAEGPKWNNTLLCITYDESGGFFDHVPPPKTVDERDEFRQLGFRVPGLVIGPHVRRGCINSNQFEHSSIIATATEKWGLDPINDRVRASNDLSSCIHPDLLDNPQPGIDLPRIDVDEDDLIRKLQPVDTQPEMKLLADSGQIPSELDLRGDIKTEVRDLIHKAREYDLVRDVFKARG